MIHTHPDDTLPHQKIQTPPYDTLPFQMIHPSPEDTLLLQTIPSRTRYPPQPDETHPLQMILYYSR
jgi:hypothetical protein